MSTPYNFEDTMRRHDAAVYHWLDDLLVDYNQINGQDRRAHPILRVFAAPHRAFAQAYDLLVKMGWAAGGNDEQARLTAEADWTTLPLPFCTIDRDYPMFTQELAASALTYERTFRDPVTGEWVVLPYPLHAQTTYRLTFWSLKRYTEAFILEWFYTRFGNRGAGNREVFLTVEHEPPFGPQMQALRWIGTGDQGELEGENPRYLRMNATVMLRTWFMRGTWPSARRETAVHAIQREAYQTEEMAATASWWGTGNLWSIVSPQDPVALARWSVRGSPELTVVGPDGLAIASGGGLDRVDLIELGSIRNDDEYQILSIAGTVDTDAPVSLEVEDLYGDPTPWVPPVVPQMYPQAVAPPVASAFGPIDLSVQMDGDMRIGTPVWGLELPAGEGSFHEFTLSYGRRFRYGVFGGPAETELRRIDVRQVFDAARTAPTSQTGSMAGTEYVWQGLEARPYLIVVRLVTPTTPGTNLVFADDAATPAFSRTRAVSREHTHGVLALLQPKVDSLRVFVPLAALVADVYVRPFDGPFLGGTLPP